MKADIIEEITRIYGYDNFDVHTANAPLYPVRAHEEKTVEDKIKDILVKRFSMHELHSYVWAYYDEMKALGIEIEDNIKLVNSTNPNIETIRKSVIPTQLCQLKANTGYAPDFGVFEIGRVVNGVDSNNLCIESKKLAISLFSKTKSTEQLYFELRDMLAVITDDIKHKNLSYKAIEAAHSYQHPKNLNAIICDGIEIGEIGIVHPLVLKRLDKKANVVFAEIDVKTFAEIESAGIAYEEVSKYPEIEIDLSFISDKFEPIAKAIEQAKCSLIKKTKVVDTYTDEKSKSITVRITFAHTERTLTREEVTKVTDKIIDTLKEEKIALRS